tara:strand:+ start:436 stop:885 length:450 start_codon:yes stop_codon:yes gene_type:complete
MAWLKEVSSSSDKVSSKRVITIAAFILMAAAFIADLGWDLTVAENVYDSMSYIVIAGLGFTAAEWFGNGKKNGKGEPTPIPHVEPDMGGFDKGYSKGYQQAETDAKNKSLVRVQNLPNSNPYERGYREGYQAAKEEHLSGNNESEEDMR